MTGRVWWQAVSAVLVGVLLALVARYVFVHSLAILVLFALGWLVAWVMDPLLDAMQRRGMKRMAAVWVVTAGFVVVLAVGGVLIVPRLVAQVQDAASHWQDYSATAQTTYEYWHQRLTEYVNAQYPGVEIMPFLDDKVAEASAWLARNIPTFLQWLSQQLIASVGLVGMGFLLLVISFHFMNLIDPLRESIRKMLPASADGEVDRLGTQINAMLGQYLRGIVLVSILTGITVTLVLSTVSIFFGTKYALILGLVSGITYMIPYVGPTVSCVSAGFFGYVTAAQSPWWACGVSIAGMLAINQVFDTFVTPRIVGQRVGLHPLVMLFSVFIGVALLGIPGMIIATPVAASMKIVLARWLPIKQVNFTAPCGKRRLDIDVAASLNLLAMNVARIRRDVETVLRHEAHESPGGAHKPPAEPPDEGEV
ncbi:AI-2E family transporter [bacterium]|nr:AI-2E family transporter [bacterium]